MIVMSTKAIIRQKRDSFIFKTLSAENTIRFPIAILLDFGISISIIYISFKGNFVIASVISVLCANAMLYFSAITVPTLLKAPDPDDDEDNGCFVIIALCIAAPLGIYILYIAVTTGITTSEILEFVFDFLDEIS